ncbi:MSC_0620 family F1-like ATPase-associated subunit [Mycoplasmopsis primatum]|uniref:MSC_0620 family F1-like ATPase-associated subunit n=1 Tax=Mycoplasmopsis primatum TaxID=55604 RepID=UPI0004974AD1|nr:hypothetical protein [Mycoplasmopsis primatum]
MNKKIKKIFKLSSLAPILLMTTAFSISAKSNNEAKPDPNFSDYDNLATDEMKKLISAFVDKSIAYIKAIQDRLIKNNETDFKRRIQSIFYFNKLLEYFEKNKDDMKTNPSKYGFYIIFPYVVAKNKKYNFADIDFNNKVYKDIKVVDDKQMNYDEAIAPKGKSKTTKKDITNSIPKDKFTAILKKYAEELINKQMNSIIFNEKDVPIIDKDVELIKDNNGNLSVSLPKDYKTWDEYIKSKIQPRFVDFDLKQNQESEDPQNEKQKPNDPPSIPPIVPDDTDIKNPNEFEKQIESLSTLFPYTSSKYAKYTAFELKNQFDSADAKTKQQFFYFNNPINTRYEYKVFSFDAENNNKIKNVIVHITDRVNPKLTKSYTISEIQLINSPSWLFLKENQIKVVKDIFSQLIQSLSMDDKLDYSLIRNKFIQDALFNMVNASSKMIWSTKENSFEWSENENINKYYEKFDNDKSIINSLKVATKYNFLTSLTSLKINANNFWKTLPLAFEAVNYQFSEIIKINKKFISENTKATQTNLENIAKLFEINQNNIYQLNALISNRTFELNDWYNQYNNLVAKIFKSFNLFSTLVINKKVTDNKELKDKFIKAYSEAFKIIEKDYKKGSKVKKDAGIVLTVIGIILLSTGITLLALKNKNKGAKHLLISGSVILSLGLSIATLGIILITLA